jgi:predicted ferric reductase
VFLTIKDTFLKDESHPFSLSSPPSFDHVRLSVKALGDFTSSQFPALQVGTQVKLEGPYGKFSYIETIYPSYIWIAGGIGITPFLSMAYTLQTFPSPVDIYYCVADQTEAVYLSELQQIAAATKNVRIIPWYSKTQGRISAENIAKISTTYRDAGIFLCGPPVFMFSLKKQFRKLGVSRAHLYSEEFAML